MANYYCDPNWHTNGAKFPAEFLILPLPEERGFGSTSYATCERHVGRALNLMLELHTQVTVHKVHNEDSTSTG